MAGSPENLIKCLKYRRHYYVELREGSAGHGGRGQHMMYHCVLCDESCNTANDILDHLMSTSHKHKLNFAKLTLLKRNNRWPFSDGILLFDASIKQEMTDSEDVRVLQKSMKLIDKDKALVIQEFDYEVVPPVGDYDCLNSIYFHGYPEKIGRAKISVRYGSANNVVEKIWCEWLGRNDPNVKAEKISHNVFRVIILKYRHDLGKEEPEFGIRADECFICNQKMIVGKDVASILHPGYTSNIGHILCCSWLNFSARYEEKVNKNLSKNPVPSHVAFQGIPGERSRNALKEFHVFHTSCLIHWILWCEYEQCKNGSPNTNFDAVEIYGLFCPVCNIDRNRQKYYDEYQMSRVKSKILHAKNEWSKNPEEHLENCSIGLHFPLKSKDKKAKVRSPKFVQFYRAEYQGKNYHSRIRESG